MRRYQYVFLVAAVMLICLGLVKAVCSWRAKQTVDPARLQGPYRVETHAGGQPTGERQLAAGSPGEQAVTAWLASHSDGWTVSYTTYAPTWVLRGDGFHLNLLRDGLCVLNYKHSAADDAMRQVVREISPAEAEALMDAVKAE